MKRPHSNAPTSQPITLPISANVRALISKMQIAAVPLDENRHSAKPTKTAAVPALTKTAAVPSQRKPPQCRR